MWMFCVTIEHKSSCENFCEYITKTLPTSYFEYFGCVCSFPLERTTPTSRNFDIYLHEKNELHS